MVEPFNHFATIRVARNDSGFAAFGIRQSILPKQQTEIALPLHPTMTDDTFAVEQRLDLRIEVNFVVGITVRKRPNSRQNDERNKDVFGCGDWFHDAFFYFD